MSVSPVYYLFDKGVSPSHPWANGLRADAVRTKPFEQASCANLAMDWRIDDVAESRLITEIDSLSGVPASIHAAIQQYFVAAYCKPSTGVKFLSETIRVPPQRELFHVGSLGGMLNRIVGNADSRSQLQDHFALTYGDSRFIPATGKPVAEEVAGIMQSGSEDDFRETVELLHELLGPRQPFWWATYRSEVEPFEKDAAALVNALGLGEYLDDDVLLTYRYKAERAGLIYRPTAVEANNYAFHYPSPQTLATGLSMPLNDKQPPCSEMLHHPLRADVAAAALLPRTMLLKAGKQLATQYDNLAACRIDHRTTLQRDYATRNTVVKNWLDRHASRF